jgi:hypothetical protein
MQRSWSFVKIPDGEYPFIEKSDSEYEEPKLSKDRRTISLRMNLLSGRDYAFMLNSPQHKNFVGANGVPVDPVKIHFKAGNDDGFIDSPEQGGCSCDAFYPDDFS